MALQVTDAKRPTERVQRVGGARDRDEFDRHQRGTQESRRHEADDREVDLAPQQGLGRTGQHRFDDLDARVAAGGRESTQRVVEERRRKDDVDGDPDRGFPARGEARGERLEALHFID